LKSSSNFRRTSAIANLLIGDVSTLRGETQARHATANPSDNAR
jgi:hypothetical protein